MATEVRVPQLGESVVDAVVGTWLKHEGEQVTVGEPLVELETDKVNVEVSAEEAGVLQQILKPEGETVGVGEVIATIAAGAAAAASAQPQAAQPRQEQQPAEQPAVAAAPAGAFPPPAENVASAPPGVPSPSGGAVPTAEPAGALRASPAVRRLAEEYGIDLSQVAGTGENGRVTREDVMRYVLSRQQPAPAAAPPSPTPASAPAAAPARPSPAPVPAAPQLELPEFLPETNHQREERVRMSRRRQTIAQRLQSVQQEAAMLTTFNEVDMQAVMDLRKRWRDIFKERHGVSLGYMSFFTKAVVGALKAFPYLNAEIQGNEFVLKRYYDIGIAVGTDEGLVVPVVRDADRKSFAAIEQDIVDLATKARDGKLTLEDLMGGTFTITNGGIYGSLNSTPILNPPQAGILGMHKIMERPVVVKGEIVARPMMYLALSYDHRIVDGKDAVQFLVRVKELIESPEQLLLEA
ncbi:MAG TPA: 2-oxoglutarate dehydrogenase complex dihydrolipoyllysine-residue succinyltransferase [Thermomicrobiaceae bacterium]|nr:2-oxoglutarate dehydrogenase complex dihydrolipoyllysine-residue succinyltransferase [Thermomicrobiaceae bacterium]